MKNNIIITMLMVFMGFISCRDEALNPIPSADFKDGVTFTARQTTSAFLDLGNLTSATKLDFETTTTRPDLISKVDVLAELVPAVGTKISKYLLTLPQLVGTNTILYNSMLTALGITAADLKPGDILKVKFVATTPDGRTFSEDNTVGTLPTGFGASSGFTGSLRTTVACVFNPAQFTTGTWSVTADDWADYAIGAPITVKAGPGANDLTLGIFATDKNHKDLVITVTNANTGAVTMAKQVYGEYTAFPPDIYSAEGTGSISGCAGTIDLVLKHSSNLGASYPGQKFSLKRK
jgi:hypothetical protein